MIACPLCGADVAWPCTKGARDSDGNWYVRGAMKTLHAARKQAWRAHRSTD